MSQTADVIIIGAGIAGASAAHWLAPHARVLLLERESQPGYHATGRSAALFMESYGPPQVRALTRASRAFLENPPEGFAEHPLLTPRGTLIVAAPGQEAELQAEWDTLHGQCPHLRRVSVEEALALLPVLRPEQVAGALHDADPCDIDVHALHQGYLRSLRQAGGTLVNHAEVTALTRTGDTWRVDTSAGTFEAPVVVNAAGAWADPVARLAGVRPLGMQPHRRSAFTFAPPPGAPIQTWPMAIGVAEDWYLKPDAAQLLGSPANADPVEPHDVQAEELDVAIGIDHIQRMTTLEIRRPSHTWAGLRTFAPDGEMVNGCDPEVPGFFWVAGQGGYGIQTSAAMGMAAAAQLLGQPLPDALLQQGVLAEKLSPARFRT